MLAAAVEVLLLTSAKVEQRVQEHAEAEAVLDAAVSRAVLGTSDARLDRRWPVDGSPNPFRFAGRNITVKVQDQLGLIDLNAADGSLIRQLLLSAGQNDDEAAAMTDRILDWRSTTGLERLHGASDAAYTGRPYRPRHGAFQSVSELGLVLGMTPRLYARLAPALTVYSGRPSFDPNTAPPEALRALYPNDPGHVAQILTKRTQGGTDALGARPGVLSTVIPLAGRAFAISAELTIDRRHYARSVVILLTGDEHRPYLVMAWQ